MTSPCVYLLQLEPPLVGGGSKQAATISEPAPTLTAAPLRAQAQAQASLNIKVTHLDCLLASVIQAWYYKYIEGRQDNTFDKEQKR